MTDASWVYQLKDDPRVITRVPGAGLAARVFPGENAMLTVATVAPGAAGSIHSHHEEQWGALAAGSCTRIQDGEQVECVVGDFRPLNRAIRRA